MPKNLRAQVKPMPKPDPSRLTRESVSVGTGLKADVIAKPAPAGAPTGRKTEPAWRVEFPASAPIDAGIAGRAQPPDSGVIHAARPTAGYEFFKRAIDLGLGSLLVVISVPIVLVAASAIRINTPGSPFFFQTRLGKNGRPFKIFKLRGMYIDARSRFPTYYDYSGKRDLEFCFHNEEDPRVTRAGRFIRKTSIDELPNLWNVLRGDMSLVGPRPEIPEVMALYGQFRDEYLSVKPGVTCLSKITGRDKLTKRETIDFDIDYIRRRSFPLDIKILWKTFCNVVLRRDVF